MLVIHALRPTSRKTTIDFLTSFSRNLPDWDVQYLHFSEPTPEATKKIKPNVLVVNYDFLNYRFTPLWWHIKDRYKYLAERADYRIALVQDDFWANKLLDRWIVDWNIDKVLSPISDNLDFLYPKSTKKAKFETVLTGYVKKGEDLFKKPKPIEGRPIDLGQRVRSAPASLGKYAQAKSVQAEEFARLCTASGFKVDVSVDVNDSLIGESWNEFLSNAKFTVGMKGGASLNDKYGLRNVAIQNSNTRGESAYGSILDYLLKREIYKEDGLHQYKAISPRLFEAALAGTCQILTPDNYLGVLNPWEHYIPLNFDLSNAGEVIEAMSDLNFAQDIANNCFKTLIIENDFTDKQLVSAALSDVNSKLFTNSDSENFAWVTFKSSLENNHKIYSTHGSDIHDYVVSMLYELWMTKGRKSLMQFKKTIEGKVQIKNLKGESYQFYEQIKFLNLEDLVLNQIDQILSRNLLKWQIWPWRPLSNQTD